MAYVRRIALVLILLLVSSELFAGTPPTINLWYGNDQTFGTVGTPQRWANILGSVSHPSGISSLSYSLNGSSYRPLNFISDRRRLTHNGDFNIDLMYSELIHGVNSVFIRAMANSGDIADTLVTVRNLSGQFWPMPYSYEWSQLGDSAQIVDGKWSRVTDGVRILEPGYDRLIAIGDTTWNSYEVTVKFTVHGLGPDSTGPAYDDINGGPAIGLIMRWKGHTNTPVFNPPVTQPLTGYLPFGAIIDYHFRNGGSNPQPNQWETLLADFSTPATSTAVTLNYGVPYYFKVQVQTLPGSGYAYRTKVWQAGATEPSFWLMTAQAPLSSLSNGSFLLMAHHVDATFGSVTVTPLADGAPPVLSSIVATPTALGATITWMTDEPATGSVAYGLTSAYGSATGDLTRFVKSHSIQLQDLQPNTLYHYAVVSTDWGSASTTSSDLTFQTTVLTPPLPPALVSPADGSVDQPTALTLQWNKPLNASKYRVQVGTDINFATGIAIDDTSAADTLKAVSGLLPGTRYYWRVSARNDAGASSFSNPSMFVTSMSVPVLVAPANGGPNVLPAPRLTWRRVASATSYRVWVSTDTALAGTAVIDDSTVVDTFRVASGLVIGQKYYWRVRAKNNMATGTFSEPWAFTPGVAPPALASPANGASNQLLDLTLQWSSEPLATSYDVQLGTDSTFAAGLVVDDSQLAATSRAVNGLASGTVYYWRVRSRNASGPGVYSSTWTFSTGLSVPQLLSPADKSTGHPLSITFLWGKVDKATSYAFQLATDSTFASGFIKNDASLVDTTRFVAGLTYKMTLYWHVRPKQGSVNGPWSATWKLMTAVKLPEGVTVIEPANGALIPPDSVRFVWTKSQPNVDRYWLDLGLDSLFNLRLIDSTIADTTTVVHGLNRGATYYWRVRAGSVDGWGPFTETRHFTMNPSGIAGLEQGIPQSFALDQNYPNPFNPSTWIHFALPRQTHVRLEVYNILGEQMATILDEGMEAGYHRVEFTGRDSHGKVLAAGIYIYRLVSPEFTLAKKMILLK